MRAFKGVDDKVIIQVEWMAMDGCAPWAVRWLWVHRDDIIEDKE